MSFDPDYIFSQLTTEEKISLTSAHDFWHTTAINKLNIPSIRCSDGPNGLRGTKFFNSIPSAVFPCGTSLAATFNKKMMYSAGELMAVEAKAKGIHIILGPTINILRSPLHGRGFEAFGEDPYLSGLIASEIVNGMQSHDVLATLKHFICNEIEDKRLGSNSILTERALREIYLKPFEITVKNANPGLIMTSYNKVNNVHCSDSKYLITDILRNQWGFEGMVISDWSGTYSLVDAYKAGLDLEFPGPPRFRNSSLIQHLLTSMEIDPKLIDDAALRSLKTIAKCLKSGISSHGLETTDNNNKQTSSKLRKIAADGIVLLKNDLNLLPLSKEDDIAIIGPNSFTSTYCGGGSAALRPYYTTTIFDSINQILSYIPESTVGCYAFKKTPEMVLYQEADAKSFGYSVKFFDKAATETNRKMLEECVLDYTHIALYDYGVEKYPQLNYCIDMEGYWKCEETAIYQFGLSVLGSAKLYLDNKLIAEIASTPEDAIGFFTEDFEEKRIKIGLLADKVYKINIEFESPQRLDFPVAKECGAGAINFGVVKIIDPLEEIIKAQEIASRHEKVILCIGLNKEWESEGYDRKSMDLPGYTNQLVESVLKVNKNCVIVNQSGTPVEFPWLDDASTLLQAWFGGNELGSSITDVLFGFHNPSGKLPMTFPYKNKDNPTYLTFKSDGGNVIYGEDIYVGYKYYDALERHVAFPFGFGLSYTDFFIKNLKVNFDDTDVIEVLVNVTNIGKLEGSEVIQVYTALADESDFLVPIKQLREFTKLSLLPDETSTTSVKISKKDITSTWADERKQWLSTSGKYKIMVGNSSDNLILDTVIELEFTNYYWL